MPLTAEGLSALVYAQHLALFSSKPLNSRRSNEATGVADHNVPEKFIDALCAGFVDALLQMSIKDLGAGVQGTPPGVAAPVPVTFPGGPAAVTQFIADMGFDLTEGINGLKVAQSLIGNVLLNTQVLAVLQMQPNVLMGTGTSLVNAGTNPDLLGAMEAALNVSLPLAFQDVGVFGEGDVPGAPVNATLAEKLPTYASALAAGVATLTATVTYASAPGSTVPVTGAINFGSIL
jgi:hypothetical protein